MESTAFARRNVKGDPTIENAKTVPARAGSRHIEQPDYIRICENAQALPAVLTDVERVAVGSAPHVHCISGCLRQRALQRIAAVGTAKRQRRPIGRATV